MFWQNTYRSSPFADWGADEINGSGFPEMKRSQVFLVGAIVLGTLSGVGLAIASFRSQAPAPAPSVAESPPWVADPEPTGGLIPAEPVDSPQSSPGAKKPVLEPDASEFSQFRRRLLDATKRRDARFVRSLVTPETQWSYGGSLTLDSYTIDDPQSTFWQHLEKATRANCAKDIRTQVPGQEPGSALWKCPDYVPAQDNSIRPGSPPVYGETSVAILGEGVNIRSGAGTNYPMLRRVSFEIFPIAGGTPKADFTNLDGWTSVQLPDGQRGYVQNRFAYHQPTDYRIAFVRKQGQWRLHYFLPGNGN